MEESNIRSKWSALFLAGSLGITAVLFNNCSGSGFRTVNGTDLSASPSQANGEPNSPSPQPATTTSTTVTTTTTVAVPPEVALGCTLFVAVDGQDTNSGKTRDQAFRTLQKASDVSTYGDVVCAEPGDYSQFSVKLLPAFDSENKAISDGILAAQIADTIGVGHYVSSHFPNHKRTRFVSVQKQKAVIHLKDRPVDIQRHFVDFEGFEVEGAQSSGINVLVMAIGSNSRILNNHVHSLSVPQSMIDSGNGGAGIDAAGLENYIGVEHEIAGNNVHDIWGPPGVKTNLIHGIYIAVPGSYVHDNTVKDIVAFCYHAWHDVQEERIENNVGSNCMGIVLGSGDNPCESDARRCHTRDLSVQNNQMSNTAYGIVIEGNYSTLDPVKERFTIKNNSRDGLKCPDGSQTSGSDFCPK